MKLIDRQNGGRWVVDRWRQSLDGNIYDHTNRKRHVLIDGTVLVRRPPGPKLAVIDFGCAAVQAEQMVASRHEIANARDEFDEATRALCHTNERSQIDGQHNGRSSEMVTYVGVQRNRCRANLCCPRHFGINVFYDFNSIFADPPDDADWPERPCGIVDKKKNAAIDAIPSTHAIVTANFGTSVSNRAPVPTANIMEKVNSPTVNLMTLFGSALWLAISRR